MSNYQKTIKSEIEFSGIGLHTGTISKIKLKPSYVNSGITFIRVDLNPHVKIKAIIDNVIDTKRGTTIGCDGAKIHTVEHLLSSIYGLGIDNIIVEINNIEPPILDGSSKPFVDKILKFGIRDLDEKKEYIKIEETINYLNQSNGTAMKVSPAENFSVNCKVDFTFGGIGEQHYKLDSIAKYENEISSARTFCSLNELKYLKENNLIKGGNLENGIVFLNKENNINDLENIKNIFDIEILSFNNKKTLNDVKLRYNDEPVRHKILDLIGDFALLGKPLIGHVDSVKGGHESNIEMVKKINEIYNNGNFKFNETQIKENIPHRAPFLLIDEIISGIPGKSATAIKNVTDEDYFFKGHFPGDPIMPGVLILECMAQTSCFLSFNNVKDRKNKMMLLSIIKSAKFIKKVIPGDILKIEVELLKFKLGTANIRGIAKVNNSIVAKAEFLATVVDKDE